MISAVRQPMESCTQACLEGPSASNASFALAKSKSVFVIFMCRIFQSAEANYDSHCFNYLLGGQYGGLSICFVHYDTSFRTGSKRLCIYSKYEGGVHIIFLCRYLSIYLSLLRCWSCLVEFPLASLYVDTLFPLLFVFGCTAWMRHMSVIQNTICCKPKHTCTAAT